MDFKEFGFLILSHFIAIYYWLEAIFRFFVSRARKDVRGDIVLVTGAGSGIGKFFKLLRKLVIRMLRFVVVVIFMVMALDCMFNRPKVVHRVRKARM